jgi:pyruvate, water dikinase
MSAVSKKEALILQFSEVNNDDVGLVGGKTASLGEMFQELTAKGVRVPNGFAITAYAYKYFVEKAGIQVKIREALEGVDVADTLDLQRRGAACRALILGAKLPRELKDAIAHAYVQFCKAEQVDLLDVAVRSSATAEDLPSASFAGQLESYLNVRGAKDLIKTAKRCMASLFTDRAIAYREHHRFDHFEVLVSIAVQRMVRSDKASAGVMFTLDTESGHRGVVLITGAWGLGENVVQGAVNVDEFLVHKPTLLAGFEPLLERRLGAKEFTMVYGSGGAAKATRNVRTEKSMREQFCLSDAEVLELARWGIIIESHYGERLGAPQPMDIEWAKDGISGELFIVQARPETVHSQRDMSKLKTYRLLPGTTASSSSSSADDDGDDEQMSSRTVVHGGDDDNCSAASLRVLATGVSVGMAITTGRAKVMRSLAEMHLFERGDVLVAETTNPDFEPILKLASAVLSNSGGRSSHAAIISRELGIPCIVGCGNATQVIRDGDIVTVDCTAGKVYAGRVAYEVQEHDLSKLPDNLGVKLCLNVGNPERALEQSFVPNDGVGLARMEFIVSNYIRAHPLALLEPDSVADPAARAEIRALIKPYNGDGAAFFVERLAQGISLIAAAFYPKRVILRFSDFKTSEYRMLLGGAQFEPIEENPMLGWRGACRYYSDAYRGAFALEVKAVNVVRDRFGLRNLDVMVPFCRTPDEGRKVIDVMASAGLAIDESAPDDERLRIMVMCELPSCCILADAFLDVFSGFSIGSNDLTQCMLGVDRNSELVAPLFTESDPAVKQVISMAIQACRKRNKYVGICGQAPSDSPEFAQFLIEQGIEAISLTADAILPTIQHIAKARNQPK